MMIIVSSYGPDQGTTLQGALTGPVCFSLVWKSGITNDGFDHQIQLPFSCV